METEVEVRKEKKEMDRKEEFDLALLILMQGPGIAQWVVCWACCPA